MQECVAAESGQQNRMQQHGVCTDSTPTLPHPNTLPSCRTTTLSNDEMSEMKNCSFSPGKNVMVHVTLGGHVDIYGRLLQVMWEPEIHGLGCHWKAC